jgi:PncC family amidohydrolase
VAYRAGQEAKDHLLSVPVDTRLSQLTARLQRVAIDRGVSVGTAESCTGGLIGHSITANPGSSRFYHGGVISYSDDVKGALLDVSPMALERHGAVSAQVAVAMAEGVRERIGCDYGVAVTGVAGPDGGSAAKPVGLTYVAAAGPDGHQVRRHAWDGDRSTNKVRSAEAALELLIDVIGVADPADA